MFNQMPLDALLMQLNPFRIKTILFVLTIDFIQGDVFSSDFEMKIVKYFLFLTKQSFHERSYQYHFLFHLGLN